jgi:hypothetical protein
MRSADVRVERIVGEDAVQGGFRGRTLETEAPAEPRNCRRFDSSSRAGAQSVGARRESLENRTRRFLEDRASRASTDNKSRQHFVLDTPSDTVRAVGTACRRVAGTKPEEHMSGFKC